MKIYNTATIVVAFLVLLNLGTLAAFWFFRPPPPPPMDRPQERMQKTNDFLKKEIGWDDRQFDLFVQSRKRLKSRSDQAIEEARRERQRLVDALLQSPPDTNAADQLADRIGKREKAIQANLIEHYLEVWEMSDEAQRARLKKVFRRTLQPPPPPRRPEPH